MAFGKVLKINMNVRGKTCTLLNTCDIIYLEDQTYGGGTYETRLCKSKFKRTE